MDRLIVQTTIPAAVEFGAGWVAPVVAFAVAAVPACVWLGCAAHRPHLPIVAAPLDAPMHHAA